MPAQNNESISFSDADTQAIGDTDEQPMGRLYEASDRFLGSNYTTIADTRPTSRPNYFTPIPPRPDYVPRAADGWDSMPHPYDGQPSLRVKVKRGLHSVIGRFFDQSSS